MLIFLKLNILKLSENIKLQIFVYIYDSSKGNLPSVLNNNFRFVYETHGYNTRNSIQNHVVLPKANTKVHGLMSVGFQSCSYWNRIMKAYPNIDFLNKSKSFCKTFITNHLLDSYNINF